MAVSWTMGVGGRGARPPQACWCELGDELIVHHLCVRQGVVYVLLDHVQPPPRRFGHIIEHLWRLKRARTTHHHGNASTPATRGRSHSCRRGAGGGAGDRTVPTAQGRAQRRPQGIPSEATSRRGRGSRRAGAKTPQTTEGVLGRARDTTSANETGKRLLCTRSPGARATSRWEAAAPPGQGIVSRRLLRS